MQATGSRDREIQETGRYRQGDTGDRGTQETWKHRRHGETGDIEKQETGRCRKQ
jgi:hypothetical protein